VRKENEINFQKIYFSEGRMKFSEEEKAKLLEGWKRSGKSISAYVKEKGLVRWTFTKWLKAERDEKTGFVEVTAEAVKQTTQALQILIEKGDVKIHIPLVSGRTELRAVMEWLGGAL
jgi:transposase-like protein